MESVVVIRGLRATRSACVGAGQQRPRYCSFPPEAQWSTYSTLYSRRFLIALYEPSIRTVAADHCPFVSSAQSNRRSRQPRGLDSLHRRRVCKLEGFVWEDGRTTHQAACVPSQTIQCPNDANVPLVIEKPLETTEHATYVHGIGQVMV